MDELKREKEFKKLQLEVSKLQKQVKILTDKLIIDNLTGAYNRRYLEDFEEEKWKNKPCYVTFVDSNKLKIINDNEGHHVGDQHLKEISDYLKGFGKVIRYGGDEFVVISEKDPISLVSKEEFSAGKVYKPCNMLLRDAISLADKIMYENKKKSKIFQP